MLGHKCLAVCSGFESAHQKSTILSLSGGIGSARSVANVYGSANMNGDVREWARSMPVGLERVARPILLIHSRVSMMRFRLSTQRIICID